MQTVIEKVCGIIVSPVADGEDFLTVVRIVPAADMEEKDEC